MPLVIKWIYNIVLFGGKNAGCRIFLSLLIDVYASFHVSLRRQASMTQAEKFPFLLLKSDVNLFNHLS